MFYVSSRSNHPRQILKQLPIEINEKLNKLSNNRGSSEYIKQDCQTAFKSAKFDFKLEY